MANTFLGRRRRIRAALPVSIELPYSRMCYISVPLPHPGSGPSHSTSALTPPPPPSPPHSTGTYTWLVLVADSHHTGAVKRSD